MKIIKRLLLLFVVVGLVVVSIYTYLGYQLYQDAIQAMPLKDKVAQIQSQSNYVPYENISPYVLEASVAIEDHRFYTHHGIDYIATTRAMLSNIFSQGIVGGGSTITQQLAKNMYFGYEQSLVRKVAEMFLVHDIEKAYEKEEILALYLNIINYGDNYIGIKAASNGYFQVEPDALTLQQASLLAGLPQSPSNYQLSNHYDAALQRQKQVLKAMVEESYITQLQVDELVVLP